MKPGSAAIASVGLRMLRSTGNYPYLVKLLERTINYYLIIFVFFELVKWQKRVQEQNAKR
jgi:hypothetical protein